MEHLVVNYWVINGPLPGIIVISSFDGNIAGNTVLGSTLILIHIFSHEKNPYSNYRNLTKMIPNITKMFLSCKLFIKNLS